MANIHVSSCCGASHVTRADGARLREAILAHWHDPAPVVIDFSGLRIASASFFDESIGLLAQVHPLEELTRRVQVVGIEPGDRALLNQIVVSRSRERQTPAGTETTTR